MAKKQDNLSPRQIALGLIESPMREFQAALSSFNEWRQGQAVPEADKFRFYENFIKANPPGSPHWMDRRSFLEFKKQQAPTRIRDERMQLNRLHAPALALIEAAKKAAQEAVNALRQAEKEFCLSQGIDYSPRHSDRIWDRLLREVEAAEWRIKEKSPNLIRFPDFEALGALWSKSEQAAAEQPAALPVPPQSAMYEPATDREKAMRRIIEFNRENGLETSPDNIEVDPED